MNCPERLTISRAIKPPSSPKKGPRVLTKLLMWRWCRGQSASDCVNIDENSGGPLPLHQPSPPLFKYANPSQNYGHLPMITYFLVTLMLVYPLEMM
ncbi:hypothetical protein EVAR_66751_1 [Eumeta japonica]|uniref:Transmembrane protein n=1 Tax=Eumeta variegata TaxID=151549 RepID=A0A4C1Z691_EUMVA|nr:hypothetical protein EVAR_66751_1 [Eumeta japonica]